MKRLMTLFALSMMIMTILSVSVYSAPKRVLVEDHTGAWCGWCVLGIQAMEDMLEMYPDKFIAVGVHNGDNMTTNLQNTLGEALAISGYPSGVINRKNLT